MSSHRAGSPCSMGLRNLLGIGVPRETSECAVITDPLPLIEHMLALQPRIETGERDLGGTLQGAGLAAGLLPLAFGN